MFIRTLITEVSIDGAWATSCSGGRSLSTRREPPTMGKQLVNFITCGCESIAPLLVIYKVMKSVLIETEINL
jgi:hypothetical protein